MKKFGKLLKSILISTFLVAVPLTNAFAVEKEFMKGDGELIPPTEKEILIESQKSKEAAEYCAKKYAAEKMAGQKTGWVSNKAVIIDDNGDKYNSVGLFRQSKGYTCGPASARNLINGFVYYNYTFANKAGGVVPSEETLEHELETTTSGTDFDASKWQPVLKKYTDRAYTLSWGSSTNWETSLKTKIMSTIDDPNCYNVIANINHGSTSTPIHEVYGKKAAHYVCVYGYNDTTKEFIIADPNEKAPAQFRCSYKALANSTRNRGVIW